MKSRITLFLLLCLALPCFALGDGIKTFNFPKEKGVPMYGATMKDELGPLHYVMFHSNDPKVTKLGLIDEDDNGTHMRNLRCGAFCGDKYYGYMVNVYSYTEQVKAFGTVDFSTGVFTPIRADYTHEDLVTWPIIYEMTYDYEHKTCWALGRNMDGLIVSDLYRINLENGDYEMVATLDFYAWAMACDYEGNLYMIKGIPDKKDEFYEASSIVRIDTENGYAEKDEKRIKVKGQDFIPNYTHSMEFDHESNRLYWLGMSNDGWQKIYDLDVNTGNAVETASMMYNMVVGLYIPFKGADSRMAAGKVTELKGSPAADGSLGAMIEWINPETNWKGDVLEALKSITISRDREDNVIASLDAAGGMGSKMSFNDDKAQKGYNVYYVTTHRVEGERGLTDSVRVFVGADVPGRPRNVTATVDGSNIRIDWQAPEQGAHGEKYDSGTTVYDITRMPDSVAIATNIKDNTFTDENIGTRKKYSYIVTASNSEGRGLSEESAQILAGSSYPLPFEEAFDKAVCKDMWTSVDNNMDGVGFEWGGGKVADFYRYQLWLNAQSDCDDYLITPPLATKKGNLYRVNFNVQLGSIDDIHRFEITTGNAETAEAQKNVIASYDNVISESYNQTFNYETRFTADEDVSYIGVHCMSYKSGTGSYFAIRDFRVEEIFSKDLAVTALNGPKDLICGKETAMEVAVKNTGSMPQNNFRVEVITKDTDGSESVIGSAEYNGTVEPDMTVSVPVSATVSKEGEIEIAARVIIEGDMNPANNVCAWNKYSVNASGTDEWNILCEGDNLGVSTTEPMNFYYLNSTVETVYLKDEIKAGKDGKITRIAYQYSDNGISAETEACNIKVYMSNTDKEGYGSNVYASDWTPLEESSLVCEKAITIVPGKDNLLVLELDEPFQYDHNKNLCIQVWKEGALDEMFPALFKTYSFGDDVFRSLRYNTNKGPFAFDDSQKFFPISNVPVLLIAMDFEEHSGIFEINGGSGISYIDDILSIHSGSIAKLVVTDVTGRIIKDDIVNAPSIRLNLNHGLYIIKATDTEGRTHVLKVTGNN